MNKDFKTSVFEQLAKVGKAFSNHNRIELLELLAQGTKTVDVLAKESGLSVANTSQHLQVLRNAGLVISNKQAQFVHYELVDSSAVDVLISLREISQQNISNIEYMLEKTMPEHSGQNVITIEDLNKMSLTDDSVTIIDLRSEDEYKSGHIDNSINIPFEDLDSKIKDIPKDKKVVTYCRGLYSLLSRESVNTLTKEGYDAHRLQNGYTEWLKNYSQAN